MGRKKSLESEEGVEKVSSFRVVSSQVLASLPLFFLLMTIGMCTIFVTIVIPDLLGASGELSFTKEQASWFGGLVYLAQPLGCIICGPICDYFGRKKSLLVVNLPQIIGWTLYYYCWNVPSLFTANFLLGIACGAMEAPAFTYIAEISDPKVRGVFLTIGLTSANVGVFLGSVLGTVFYWKTAAIVILAFVIMSCILVNFIPESPLWLLSQGHEAQSLESLCWLRGWCAEEHVQAEFQDLFDYNETKNQCIECMKITFKVDCDHNNLPLRKRLRNKMKYTILVKETMRPMWLITCYLMAYCFSGVWPARSNTVNLSNAFGMTVTGETVLLMAGVLGIVSNTFSAIFVKLIGKRNVTLIALFGTFACSSCLAIYAMIFLKNVSSFAPITFPNEKKVLPTVLFLMMYGFFGFSSPAVLLSEVFPFKSRGPAAGIAFAVGSIFIFLSSKTYMDVETHFEMSGAFFVNAGFALFGFFLLYMFMPETENKTLAEIEAHFSGNDLIVDSVAKRIMKGKKKTGNDLEQLEHVLNGNRIVS